MVYTFFLICRGKSLVDPLAAVNFSNRLIKIINDENMTTDQIYNTDDIGRFIETSMTDSRLKNKTKCAKS